MMLKLFFFAFFAIFYDLTGESFVITLVSVILSFVSTVESNSKKIAI